MATYAVGSLRHAGHQYSVGYYAMATYAVGCLRHAGHQYSVGYYAMATYAMGIPAVGIPAMDIPSYGALCCGGHPQGEQPRQCHP